MNITILDKKIDFNERKQNANHNINIVDLFRKMSFLADNKLFDQEEELDRSNDGSQNNLALDKKRSSKSQSVVADV
jgi:hypothetical protein